MKLTVLCAVIFCALRFNGFSQPILDLNGNGVEDIWEHKFDATSLVATELAKASDADDDGMTNIEEALAGTNPWSNRSVFRIISNESVDGTVRVKVQSEAGKQYQLMMSTDLVNWSSLGGQVLATSSELVISQLVSSVEDKYYKVMVVDSDSDGDGLSDWSEWQLAGFDPGVTDTNLEDAHSGDLLALVALLQNPVTLSKGVAEAYEKEQQAALVTISRSGDLSQPRTVFLRFDGNPILNGGSADSSDYQLRSKGADIDKVAVIPAGMASVDVSVIAKEDTRVEVPEVLTLRVVNTEVSAAVTIYDARNLASNERLFVAQLRSEVGGASSGSGLATLLLSGDNSQAQINVSFFGLTSLQSAAHLHIKNPESGPHVESLPLGQVVDHRWDIKAAQFIVTDQSMLEALLDGSIYINIHSSNYPAGEIRGDFSLTHGSTEMQLPAEPPAVVPLTGDALGRDIARFLTQATFGPTPELMDELRALVQSEPYNGDRIAAFSAWIDSQMLVPSPDLEPYVYAADAQQRFLASIEGSPSYKASYVPGYQNRRHGWWLLARHAPDHLRQRVAFALSEVFVTSSKDVTVAVAYYGHSHYYDMLKNSSFGTYRELIEGVSKHPIMGGYLSHLRNQKGIVDAQGQILVSPDENYAREVMQLFSIGLVKLHADGSLILASDGQPLVSYDQYDIIEMAKVFTGWSFSKINSPSTSSTIVDNTNFFYGNGSTYYQAQWSNPMVNFADYHDEGEKNMSTLGLFIPAGNDGEQDLDMTLDFLSQHPNTAPFISRKLIQRLVTSNPSAGYLYRVSQTWIASGGDLGEVVKAILLDPEARSLEVASSMSSGKKKEPLVHALALARALDIKSALPLSDLDPRDTSIVDISSYAYAPAKLASFADELDKFPAGVTRARMYATDQRSTIGYDLGQTPLQAPTVFNWFSPDFICAGAMADAGVKAPEFQIANEVSVVRNVNYLYVLLYWTYGRSGVVLPNQGVVSDDGVTLHPEFNPYGYAIHDDHFMVDWTANSALRQAYLSIMDSNADGEVTPLDAAFNDHAKVTEASEAVVDHLDLLLASGRMKAAYAEGYTAGVVRAANPRDVIIDAVANYEVSWDASESSTTQSNVLVGRLKLAAYLMATSPSAIIQN